MQAFTKSVYVGVEHSLKTPQRIHKETLQAIFKESIRNSLRNPKGMPQESWKNFSGTQRFHHSTTETIQNVNTSRFDISNVPLQNITITRCLHVKLKNPSFSIFQICTIQTFRNSKIQCKKSNIPRRQVSNDEGFQPQFQITKNCLHFSICACHPCAGAMLIFSVSFQSLYTSRFVCVNHANLLSVSFQFLRVLDFYQKKYI